MLTAVGGRGLAVSTARRGRAGSTPWGGGGPHGQNECPDPTSALAALSGHLCVALMRRSGAIGPATSFCQGESSVATLTLGSLAARGGGGTGRGTWLLGQKQVLRPHQRAHRTTTTLARLAGAQELSGGPARDFWPGRVGRGALAASGFAAGVPGHVPSCEHGHCVRVDEGVSMFEV